MEKKIHIDFKNVGKSVTAIQNIVIKMKREKTEPR